MKLGFYPGCSLEGSSREYGESIRAIAPYIGLELEEVENWNCCGSSSAHALDHTLSLALPARVLAQAEKQGLREVVVPCAACYNRLASTQHELREDRDTKEAVISAIKMPYAGTTAVHNILDVLEQCLTPQVTAKFPATFPYKTVCYYGCLLVRPPKVLKSVHHEDPRQMDDLLKKIGATPLDWGLKTECCGAGFTMTRTDIVADLCSKILEDASERKAEAIIVACPMCHSNLDMRRKDTERITGKKFTIPVLYISQAIGLALGLSPKELGLQRHFVNVALQGKMKVQKNAQVRASAAVA